MNVYDFHLNEISKHFVIVAITRIVNREEVTKMLPAVRTVKPNLNIGLKVKSNESRGVSVTPLDLALHLCIFSPE